jgi:Na+/H+-dicarboxylate symporter
MMAPVIIVPGNNTVRPIGSHVWMALGLAAGLGLGLAAVLTHSPLLLAATQWLRPLGTLFLNLLSMVVIPLVATALFAGIAGLGDLRRVGRLGVRTLGFLWGTTLAGIVIGFVVAGLLLPLAPITPDQQAALRQTVAADSGAVGHAAEQITTGARFIVELIPSNPVRAAVDGNLLPLIVFVTIFAVAAAALPDEKRHTLTDLADVATQALIRIVRWVLLLAPLGIFAIVAGAVAKFGLDLIKTMALFILTVIAGLAVFIAVVYLPAVAVVGRLGARRYLRAIRASLLMAFSTTSSLTALPIMLEAAESDLRLSRTVASFVLPLGASVGRAGSALFQAVAVLFVARLYGIPLGLGGTFQAGAAVFLASLTVASVPSASIVSLVPAFTATGLPLSGLQLLLGFDRVPDMFRTMTNVFGTLTAATVVDAVESRDQEGRAKTRRTDA